MAIVAFTFSITFLSIWCGYSVLFVTLAILAASLPLVWYCQSITKCKGLATAYLIVISMKLVYLMVTLLVHQGDAYNAIIVTKDADVYLEQAFWTQEEINGPMWIGVNTAYSSMLSFIASSFNISKVSAPIILVIPNIFAGSMLAVLGFGLTRYITKSSSSKIVFWLIAFDPTLMRYSTMLMKDVLCAFLVTLVLIVSSVKLRSVLDIVARTTIFILSLTLVTMIRFRSFIVTGLYLLIGLLRGNDGITSRRRYIWVTVLCLAFFIIPLIAERTWFPGSLTNVSDAVVAGFSFDEKWLDIEMTSRASNQINRIPIRPLRVLIRFISSLLTPLPIIQFHRVDTGQMWNRFELDVGAMYWHLFLPFLIFGTYILYQKKEYVAILAFYSLIFGMALTSWSGERWRFMGEVPAYIIVAAGIIGVYYRRGMLFKYRRICTEITFVYFFLVFSASLIY